MDMNQYLNMFIDESNDHLQSLNEKMLQLESNPTDLGIVQVIFRSAHTLKGMAATMGFEDLASLTRKWKTFLILYVTTSWRCMNLYSIPYLRDWMLWSPWCSTLQREATEKRMSPLLYLHYNPS